MRVDDLLGNRGSYTYGGRSYGYSYYTNGYTPRSTRYTDGYAPQRYSYGRGGGQYGFWRQSDKWISHTKIHFCLGNEDNLIIDSSFIVNIPIIYFMIGC